MVHTNPKQRRFLQFAGLAVIAGLLLATGGFIGNAIADDTDASSEPANQDNGGLARPSLDDRFGESSFPSLGSQSRSPGAPRGQFVEADRTEGGLDEFGIATSPAFYNRCQGNLGGVVSGGTIEPSSAGFDSNFLSARFILQSLNLRAEADCEDRSQQFLTMDTSWQTADALFQVWVTQRESDEPGANILRDTWAEFWHSGYYYSVSAGQSYPVEPLIAEFDGDTDAAIEPLFVENSAEVNALLRDVVEELTGDATLQCFYRQVEGGWDSLAGLGVGDPRPALPSGFTEADVYAQVFEAPSSDCSALSDVQLPTSFNANWTDGRDGWLGFNVYQFNEAYADEFAFGRSNEWGISWSDGRFQYELYGNRNGVGVGLETLEAIAVTVDPAFYQSCRIVEREFSQEELAQAGIGWPQAPDGYTLTDIRASGSEATDGCSTDVKGGNVSANWIFQGDNGEMLNAAAWTDGSGDRFGGYEGFISSNNIEWQSASGTVYSVESWTGRDEGGDRDAMIALAKSLDPGTDIDSFGDGPERERPPIALPVEEDAGGVSDGGSSASE